MNQDVDLTKFKVLRFDVYRLPIFQSQINGESYSRGIKVASSYRQKLGNLVDGIDAYLGAHVVSFRLGDETVAQSVTF